MWQSVMAIAELKCMTMKIRLKWFFKFANLKNRLPSLDTSYKLLNIKPSYHDMWFCYCWSARLAIIWGFRPQSGVVKRSTCLASRGFICIACKKMGSGVTCNWCLWLPLQVLDLNIQGTYWYLFETKMSCSCCCEQFSTQDTETRIELFPPWARLPWFSRQNDTGSHFTLVLCSLLVNLLLSRPKIHEMF